MGHGCMIDLICLKSVFPLEIEPDLSSLPAERNISLR